MTDCQIQLADIEMYDNGERRKVKWMWHGRMEANTVKVGWNVEKNMITCNYEHHPD